VRGVLNVQGQGQPPAWNGASIIGDVDVKKSLPILIAGAVVLVIGFLMLKPSDENPASTTTAASTATAPVATTATAPKATNAETVVIKNGEPVGGIAKLSYKQGSTVRLTVTTDGPETEVHVHGYDIEETAAPGAPAKFVFKAKNTGRFEVEAHPATQIARLDVVP
jgi:lipoprotein-anchoring transpeptidase ErfK/SrfK